MNDEMSYEEIMVAFKVMQACFREAIRNAVERESIEVKGQKER